MIRQQCEACGVEIDEQRGECPRGCSRLQRVNAERRRVGRPELAEVNTAQAERNRCIALMDIRLQQIAQTIETTTRQGADVATLKVYVAIEDMMKELRREIENG